MKNRNTPIDYKYMLTILSQIHPLFSAPGAKGITLAREVTEAFNASPEPNLLVFARQWANDRGSENG